MSARLGLKPSDGAFAEYTGSTNEVQALAALRPGNLTVYAQAGYSDRRRGSIGGIRRAWRIMQPEKLRIAHREFGADGAAVELSGPIMIGSGSEQIEQLTTELLGQGKRIIVFDLSGVTALDSTGIGQFISSYNQIGAAGGEMRLAAASARVLHALHVNRLDSIFPLYPTVQDAGA